MTQIRKKKGTLSKDEGSSREEDYKYQHEIQRNLGRFQIGSGKKSHAIFLGEDIAYRQD